MPASLFVATFLMFSQQGAVTEPVLRANYLVEMDQQFHNMDGDGDGLVTPQEVAARQNADGRAQVLAANQQIFLQLDQDSNGMLTAEEFARLAGAPAPTDPAPFMQRIDLDQNGAVSLVEHRTVMLDTFDNIDADKDGVVTPEEMTANTQAQQQAQQQQAPASQGR